MATITLFETRMEKALLENHQAMYAVELGDSHRHAFLKGARLGLEAAMKHYRDDVRGIDSEDGV